MNTSAGDTSQKVLMPNVKVEPLVDSWYAWPQLLSPPLQALNLAYRYLPTLESFASSPHVHVSASADPAMFGGPFVDLPATAVETVREYVDHIERKRADALRFARAFRELDTTLLSSNGHSLDAIRRALPEALRGRVEMAYTLANHPKLRILEEMFQDDDMGHGDSQELMLHAVPDDERPFFLSTPRLFVPDSIRVRTRFGSEAAEMLARARAEPTDLLVLARLLDKDVSALARYFTDAPGSTRERYVLDGVRVSYFGHASILVETKEVSVLVDPTAAYDASSVAEHFCLTDLPAYIDFVLISHGHQDHCSVEMLMQLRPRVGTVIIPPSNAGEPSDPSLRKILTALGFDRVRTLSSLESVSASGICITSLPFSGEHCDLDVHAKQCFLLDIKGRRICFFVDSDAIDLDVYKRLAPRLHRPDLAFIGMECMGAPLSWLYGPLMPKAVSRRDDESRRLSGANFERAWGLTQLLSPKSVCVYAMGQEPWMRHLMGLSYREDSIQLTESSKFVDRCCHAGIPAERLEFHKVIAL